MTTRISSAIRGVLAAAVFATAPMTALAADLIAPGGSYVVAQPDSACAKVSYLKSIERRFRIQAREVHHWPDLSISSITQIRENRYVASSERARAVDQLYCRASATTSDGHSRTLWYLVEFGAGFAGAFGDNVEFCLSGLDRWNVYDGYCRVLR